MPKLTARRLLRVLRTEAKNPASPPLNEAKKPTAPPLNLDKWRGALRDIRGQLIKLRDKAEDELDRVEKAAADDEHLTAKEAVELDKLEDRMTACVDNIAQAINNIDLSL